MPFLSAFKNTFLSWVLLFFGCGGPSNQTTANSESPNIVPVEVSQPPLKVAANRTGEYLPLLEGKKIAVVANQTTVIFHLQENKEKTYTHLVDSLLSLSVDVRKVFAPEHGFRGRADAGELVEDGLDVKTGLPIISLYGANRKPDQSQLDDVDLVLFDIQDVGVRFYTYIATMQLVMEACAVKNIPVVVLDRPNPNDGYVDGPTMEDENRSFLGLTNIPLVYGMTIGEYATMINEENWLEDGRKVSLTVIPMENYSREQAYDLPVRPSPNLPNPIAVALYPSLGLFEGTNINAGRGTDFQFQRFGAPFLDADHFDFSYTPKPNFGAKNPKHKDLLCYGKDLSEAEIPKGVGLLWLLEAYNNCQDKSAFFNTASFTKHAGTSELQKQIEAGWSEEAIKKSWEEDLIAFRKIRAKYLIYD